LGRGVGRAQAWPNEQRRSGYPRGRHEPAGAWPTTRRRIASPVKRRVRGRDGVAGRCCRS